MLGNSQIDNHYEIQLKWIYCDQLVISCQSSHIYSKNPLDHIRELSARLIVCLLSEEPVQTQPAAQLKQRSSNLPSTTAQQ